jgi:hypothetical protein
MIPQRTIIWIDKMSEKELIIRLVHYINCMVEGDDVSASLRQDMYRWGFWDEDGCPVYDDDVIIYEEFDVLPWIRD